MEAGCSDEWADLTPEEKKRKLYEKQKVLLGTFLEHGAITQEQHDKRMNDLIRIQSDIKESKHGRETISR